MGTPRFTPEFKEEAVRQITERGYSVGEGYTVLVRTPLNSYRTSFVVWRKGESMMLKPD